MAGEAKSGSSVFICTDGLANKGLGSFGDEKKVDEKVHEAAKQFYRKVA